MLLSFHREYPVKVMEFGKRLNLSIIPSSSLLILTTYANLTSLLKENNNIRIHQMSAGVDISMAVSTEGDVYAWGKAADGRLGVGIENRNITLPEKVEVGDSDFKAVDVECGYVHSMIVGLDGSVYQCGGVGTEGKEDGQQTYDEGKVGSPILLSGHNIWHRIAEPKEKIVKQQWQKYGKYELKGRSKMMQEGVTSIG